MTRPATGSRVTRTAGGFNGELSMRAMLGFALVIGLTATAAHAADEKIDGKKLLGKWELADGPPGGKVFFEMTKDGKIITTIEVGGKTEKMEGTYKLDGNKLTLVQKLPGGKEDKETMTITKLTDDELETKDEKGKTDKLKKVKK
jgi:uncharacterized protein (TIGR03066 family)